MKIYSKKKTFIYKRKELRIKTFIVFKMANFIGSKQIFINKFLEEQ